MKKQDRQPWHYDATKGRPAWSTALARLNVLRRQGEKLDRRRGREGAGNP